MLQAKLQVPHVLETAVRRDHLLARMASDDSGGSVITVVSAPPGAGKTSLLAQRTMQLRAAGMPVAWFSVTEEDDDAATLWTGILTACRDAARAARAGSVRALATLMPPAVVGPGFVDAFVAAVSEFPQGCWLVLDDVNEIVTPSTLEGLGRLMIHLPPGFRLMLGCRHDPPLPTQRLILEGTATEIRAADLALSRAEAASLLSGHGLDLPDQELDLLLTLTEGWAAGVRMAALLLARQADPSGYVPALADGDRAVAAYLCTEVIDQLPRGTVEFLRATAVPEWLTLELASELSGRKDAGDILQELVRENALVFRRDTSPQTYRYHGLLRRYLLAEYRRTDAAALRGVHGRVSDWYGSRGEPLRALHHATEARDRHRVVQLVAEEGVRLILSEGGASVSRVLDLARDVVLTEPRVAVVSALSALFEGDVAGAARLLDLLGRDVTVHRSPHLRLLHAIALIKEAQVSGVRLPGLRGLAEITRTNATADPHLGLLSLAARGIAMVDLGDTAAADACLEAAFEAARRLSSDLVAMDCLEQLTRSAATVSDFPEMVARGERAICFATERGWATSSASAMLHVTAGWGSWQVLDDGGARRHSRLAAALDLQDSTDVGVPVCMLLSFSEFSSTHDHARLREGLHESWARSEAASLSPREVSGLCLLEMEAALAHGNDAWAGSVLDRGHTLLADTADVDVLTAMVQVSQGRPAAARRMLAPVVLGERSCVGMEAPIAAWLLEAHLAAANGEAVQARQAVAEAVERAAPRCALRTFVTTSSQLVRGLLLADRGTYGAGEGFVTSAVSAMEQLGTKPGRHLPGGALTARERELLRDLPSLLTLDEIAAAHVVSVNTVKTHLKAMYRKLDVSSRRGAVERAQEFGLL